MLTWKKLPAEYYKILKRPPQRLFNIKINSEPYVISFKFSFSDGLKDKKNTRIIHFQIFLFFILILYIWINKLAGRFRGGSINQSKHFRWSPRICVSISMTWCEHCTRSTVETSTCHHSMFISLPGPLFFPPASAKRGNIHRKILEAYIYLLTSLLHG